MAVATRTRRLRRGARRSLPLVIAFAFLALAAGAHRAHAAPAPQPHAPVVNGSTVVTADATAARVQDAARTEHTNANAARRAAPVAANPPRSASGTPDRTATAATGTRLSTDGSRAPPRVA